MDRDFFVGWSDQVPLQSSRAMRALIGPGVIVVLTLMLSIVFLSKKFNSFEFELNNLKTFTGIYFEDPFPVLILDEGQSPIKQSHSALLVGYGKHGAETYLKRDTSYSISGHRIEITGTLIHGDGKVLIELTEKEKSLKRVQMDRLMAISTDGGMVKLQGEIVDPKCWFGVMKPGEGKVHKSCAIRCISGGIPPVLRVTADSKNTYYVLKGEMGQDINAEVLDFVAERIALEGSVQVVNGWNVLYVNPDSFYRLN